MKLTNLHKMQVPTWSWLKMNDTQLEIDADLTLLYNGGSITAPKGVKIRHEFTPFIDETLPSDFAHLKDFVHKHKNYSLSITISEGWRSEEPIFVDFLLDDSSPLLIDYIQIHGLVGSKATVVIRYRSVGSKKYFHGGFTSVRAEVGSEIRLVKLQLLGSDDTHLDGTAILEDDDAITETIFCDLGANEVIAGCNVSLVGKHSKATVDTLYLGVDQRVQDFNYRLELRGEQSEGEVISKGALSGRAKKTLKSTLDFIRGAVGSKGRETETVLLLSDTAVNLSTPLLLCGEDDVEGEHATSSGKIDPNALYYLMSRGFSASEARKKLIEASFTPIIKKLPSRELQELVQEKIREVIHGEE